jgi:TPR repeat protein
MPNLIGLGAGVGATALTLALGVAFWPHMDKTLASGKSTVSQPVFVAAVTPPKQEQPARPAAPAAQATPAADTPDNALAKLAVALKSESTTVAATNAGATRSLAFAATARPISAAAPEAARRLCAQGLVALASGDIAGARLYLERAAEGGDNRALMALGTTYDPATLSRMGALGIKGDPAKAREYYGKALAAGMGAAKERIAALNSL